MSDFLEAREECQDLADRITSLCHAGAWSEAERVCERLLREIQRQSEKGDA